MEHHHQQHDTASLKHVDDASQPTGHKMEIGNESMMSMYFHSGFGDQFLFKSLVIDSYVKMFSVCAMMFLLSVCFEAIKYFRCVRCGCPSSKPRCLMNPSGEENNETQNTRTNNSSSTNVCYVSRFRTRRHKLLQTSLHTIQTALGFLLMLAAMSYNLCIIFAIILGVAVGYYIFYRSYNEVESIESCH